MDVSVPHLDPFLSIDEDVPRFQVPVDDALRVDVVHPRQDLPEDVNVLLKADCNDEKGESID